MKTLTRYPRQKQVVLPLLEAIDERGGAASPKDVYEVVADHFDLPAEARSATADKGAAGGEFNVWHRTVRFARQRAVADGLIDGSRRNLWALTDHARRGLANLRPGLVFLVFETDRGLALWGEVESAMALVDDASVNLLVTSPPYPLERQKQYGNRKGADYIDWLVELAAGWYEKLTDDGSLWLNLGNAWLKGTPEMSLYQERLLLRLVDDVGYHLAEKLYYASPNKLPGPAEWVTVRRIRVTDAVEHVYWLAKNPRPTANNANALRAYSESMRKRLAAGGERGAKRPSGHTLSPGAFAADHGGAIASNLVLASNSSSNDAYVRGCRERGLPVHPARFSEALPDLAIRLCTDRCSDPLVWDAFGGSGVTAQAADKLGVRWMLTEKSLTYLEGAAIRFENTPGFRSYFDRLDRDAPQARLWSDG